MNRHALRSLGLVLFLSSTLVRCPAAEPFDYFRNSWNVIGLKDYKDGTRVTPENELLLSGGGRVRLACGPNLAALGRGPVKLLHSGWMPIVHLGKEEAGVRYAFTLWATPLPSCTNWLAAYDWPTEGENFLNWIRVEAVNTGTTAAEARVRVARVGGTGPNLLDWTLPLAPGQRGSACVRIPFAGHPEADSYATQPEQLWFDRTVDYWRGVLASGAQIDVPCAKSTETLRAAHVCQLIANDRGELHAGEGFYDEFYIRDGGYQLLELEEAGLWEPARKAIAFYLKAQRPDGRFETQSNQYDANGQALWTLWQYWKMTRDDAWLRDAFPAMRRAVEWIRTARRQAPAGSPWAGLLPAAPADGEFLWDGKHHIVGYDLWNLRGLLCTADAARALGAAADAQACEQEAADYRGAIDAAMKRTGLAHFPPSWEKDGTHWGNTETLWPTRLFAPDDPRVGALLKDARERHGGGFVEGTLRWTGLPNVIHPYLSSYTTMASLVRGEHDRFVEEFYWYLLHSSASHAFPEGIYFKRRYAWSETIPHVLGAANFAFLLRHALVHEQGDEVHLLAGVPDAWLAEGQVIRVRQAPTHFGEVNLAVRGKAGGVEIEWDAPRRNPPSRTVVHVPASRPVLTPPAGITVAVRPDQARAWDFATVVDEYRKLPAAQAKPIPGLLTWPLPAPVALGACTQLDLASLANTDPMKAPFGVLRPGKYLFTGLASGSTTVAGVPFRLLPADAPDGRRLVVLQGAGASSTFPREVTVRVGAQGRRLYFLGNVHGYLPDDEGAGDAGAVAEYVIHYADGVTQVVPLISHRTADDWASAPDATEVAVGLQGDPWHLNVLGVTLRPVAVETIVLRDLGTPAAPVLAAITLER